LAELKISQKIFWHFGGGYDAQFFIGCLLEAGFTIEKMIPNGSLIMAIYCISPNGTKHAFHDSIFIFHCGLDAAAKAFKAETKKGKYDHSKNRKYNKEMSEYLKSDCVALWQSLYNFFNHPITKSTGGGVSISSIAIKKMQEYLDDEVFSLPQGVADFCRSACYGGRVEIYAHIAEKSCEYDINAMYAAAARGFFPTGLPIETSKFKEGKLGIYDVIAKCPDMNIPFLPLKFDKQTYFPGGEFKTRVTSADIIYAKKLGYKIKVLGGYYWNGKKEFYKDFVTEMYEERQKTKDEVEKDLRKRMNNHFYGRLLIRKQKEVLTFIKSSTAKYFGEFEHNKNTYEIYVEPVELDIHSNEAHAAFILSYSKIPMHEKMMDALKRGAKLYYTDTDSLHMNKQVWGKGSSDFGEMKLEKNKKTGEEFAKTVYLVPKGYIRKYKHYKKIALKGFDKKKIKKLTYEDFFNCFSKGERIKIIEGKKFKKFRSALKDKKLLSMRGKQTKEIRSVYKRRIIDLKNNCSYPIIFGYDKKTGENFICKESI